MSKLLRSGGSLLHSAAAKSRSASASAAKSPLIAKNRLAFFYNNQQYRVYASTTLHNLIATAAPSLNEKKSEAFLNGSSAAYIEEIYAAWLQDPKSVHKSWDIYFRTNSVQQPSTLGLEKAPHSQQQHLVAASSSAELNSILSLLQQMSANMGLNTSTNRYAASLIPSTPEEKLVEDHLKLYALIRSYQIRGHKKASLDPLALGKSLDVTSETHIPADLTPEFYNFTAEDMSREFKLPKTTFINGNEPTLTLAEIIARLNKVSLISRGGRDWVFLK